MECVLCVSCVCLCTCVIICLCVSVYPFLKTDLLDGLCVPCSTDLYCDLFLSMYRGVELLN